MNKKAVKKQFIPYLGLGIFIVAVLFFMNMANNTIEMLSYNEFIKQINDVEKVTITLFKGLNKALKNPLFSQIPIPIKEIIKRTNGSNKRKFDTDFCIIKRRPSILIKFLTVTKVVSNVLLAITVL